MTNNLFKRRRCNIPTIRIPFTNRNISINLKEYPSRITDSRYWPGESSPAFWGETTPKNIGEQLKAYSGWVGDCVSLIAERVASIPLRLYNKNDELVEEHPFYDLFKTFNPDTTEFAGKELISINLDLTGECYVLMLKDRLGIPRELHVMRPDRMALKVEKGIITYYIYKEGMKEIIFPKEDILYFRYPNPIDPLRGASPVQRKAYAYDTDKYNMIYQLNMFKNGAHLKAVLESVANIDEDKAKKILTLFNQTYSGVDNSNKTGILTGGLTYKTTGMSNKDMEFMLLAEWTMRQLASAYHIPPQKLSHPESTNLANMEALDTAWNRECILPRLVRQEQVYNSFLLSLYKEEGLYCKYDNPVPEDKEYELRKRDSNLLHFVITPNEARAEDGYDEVPWGKVPLVPFNIMPLSSSGNVGGNEPEPAPEPEPEKTIIKKEITEEYKENYWKGFIKKVTPLENEFRRGMSKLFQEQENEALRALRKGKAIKKDIDDVLRITHNEREISKFVEFVLPRITEIVSVNGNGALTEIGIDIAFDVTSPLVRKWIKKRCGDLIKDISDTTLDKLKLTLAEGIDAGESIPKLASRISAVYDEAKGYRAERIARTETITASNRGALEGYKQSGVVEKKQWYTALDERTCAECMALHQEIVGLDENFSGGVSAPALHPNCRCTILPIISE